MPEALLRRLCDLDKRGVLKSMNSINNEIDKRHHMRYKFRKMPIQTDFSFHKAFNMYLAKSKSTFVICYRTCAIVNTTHCFVWNCDKRYILDCTSTHVEPKVYSTLGDIDNILQCLQTDVNRCCLLRMYERFFVVGKKK